MVKIRVEVEIRPTEDERKVKKAVLNVFEPEKINIINIGERRLLVAEANSYYSLLKLHELLRRERILDAARSYMIKGMAPGLLVFKLNKQAAYMGHVSFVDYDSEAPLGPITFIIETSRVSELVDWLAPPTRMGRPVKEYDMPKE